MTILDIHSCPHHSWGDGCDAWRLITSAELGVVLERVPPGRTESRHRHQRARQVFFVLAGTATFELDGEVISLARHQAIHVPAGAPHLIRNDGEQVLEFLLIAQPDSLGDRSPA
jgi:mannose-6-phosphate isomerase-like protein (cupin superfamily)